MSKIITRERNTGIKGKVSDFLIIVPSAVLDYLNNRHPYITYMHLYSAFIMLFSKVIDLLAFTHGFVRVDIENSHQGTYYRDKKIPMSKPSHSLHVGQFH